MQKEGMCHFLVHGEVTHADIDIFDREKAVFIETVLSTAVTENFPELKIVLEHITTKESVDFVEQSSPNNSCSNYYSSPSIWPIRNHMLSWRY